MNQNAIPSPAGDGGEAASVFESSVPAPTKTPLYQAMHAVRYQRQAIIKEIQNETHRRLICYVAGPSAAIDREDTVAFGDLLHNVASAADLDLLLHTGGGDIDAAEKLITMLRNRVGSATLRIVVPDFAKSAGTLMALGADRVVMSDTSELGPIDPQIILSDSNGNRIRHSVQSYLDAYESLSELLNSDPTNAAARLMLSKLDPQTVKLFESVRERSRRFAETQLKRGMFRGGVGNYTKIASELINTKQWLSHGQMIGAEDAQAMGLSVQYLDPASNEWQRFWQLYCLQRLEVRDRQKLFESDYASLVLDAAV